MHLNSQILHLFYVFVMLTGSVTVGVLSHNPKEVPKLDYFIAFLFLFGRL